MYETSKKVNEQWIFTLNNWKTIKKNWLWVYITYIFMLKRHYITLKNAN